MNQSPQKILIVEDEALIGLQIEEQLERFGYEIVSQVTYGEEVLEEVKKCHPDLIMMDINLKGEMTGIEAAHQVRSFSNIPIIFLTAYGDKKMLEEAKQTSPHGFLTKPFRSQELNAAVELGIIRHQTEEDLRIKQEHFEKLARGNNNSLLKSNPNLKEDKYPPSEKANEAETDNKTKDEFLSRMNHEFRTPLNSIMGFSQILNSETDNPLSKSQKEKVDSIINSGNHILKLVDNILDQKTIEKDTLEMNFEEISLNRLIEEAFDEVKESASKKRLHIIYETPPDEEIWVSADQEYLKKVLTHILNNAIKYNRNKGNIGISIELNESQIARLKISDSGTGIPLEKQNRIFKPFNSINSTHNYEEGIGLSLSISKALIEMMKGKVSFESQLSKGSKFFIDLPVIKKTDLSIKNINKQVFNISSYNSLLEKEINQETDLFKIAIPEKIRLEFLKAAEIYNYSALESLINELSSYSEDGKLIAEQARKHLQEYNVENIIELFNKIKQDS
jgi:signal transduction histidine kinase